MKVASEAIFGTVFVSLLGAATIKLAFWIAGWSVEWREAFAVGFLFVVGQALLRVLVMKPVQTERESPPFRAETPFRRGRL